MKRILFFYILISSPLVFSQVLHSPDSKLTLYFSLTENGVPQYELKSNGHSLLDKSTLGLALKNTENLISDFEVTEISFSQEDSFWTPVLGTKKQIRNHFNQMNVCLHQKGTSRQLVLIFRMFDEGLAFRYEVPKQEHLNYFIVTDEKSTFNLTKDYHSFWIPGDYDSQEYVYHKTRLSEINTEILDMNNGIGMKGPIGKYRIQSPVMFKSDDGWYANIFEAALFNYPVMHLDVDVNSFQLKSHLVPNVLGDKAYLQAPFSSPWRTVMFTQDPRDIVGSDMILNLNEPSKIQDISWIKPMKYVGIWWEMHVGISTWDYSGSQHAQTNTTGSVKKATHGATTENTLRYIDFAAKHGFDGVLVEGWNTGWEDWFGNWKDNVFDFVTPYPDFDVSLIKAYAKEKGVQMIMHHETSGAVSNYERRLDRAFDFMKTNDYQAVKTGYVGKIIPRGEWHDGQSMVNHFNHVLERAADYKIMINSHESVRPTGTHRTYPNFIAAEAARGNEFNAWSVGNPPSHESILVFTRMLGGPMDYTPGIFETQMRFYDPTKTEQVQTTLAKQLALYVVLYSPLQMAADLPENYQRYPDAFQFIKDVGLDWDQTEILEAEPGEFVTIARKEKNTEKWFLGAITNENSRKTTLALDFLNPDFKYEAVIYEDKNNAHWKNNPKAYQIRKLKVNHQSKITLQLAPGGGAAVSIVPLQN